MIKKVLNILFIASILFIYGCAAPIPQYKNLDVFAKCMSDKGVAMYGAYWCENCVKQKEEFGDAFKNVNYVECDAKGENPNVELCAKKGIEGYPTWELSDKSKLVGLTPLETLAQKTNCTLEKNDQAK